MRVSLAQINQYLDKKLTTSQLEQAFAKTEVEVEEIIVAEELDVKVVVAEIVEASPIDGSDKLQVCRLKIDSDSSELIDVVCGAANARAGIRVAFAQAGTELPGGFKIAKRKIFGHQSNGMICGADELGLAKESSKIMELTGDNLILGQPISSILEEMVIFDLSLPSNRWDYFSIIGLAREVSVHTEARLKLPEIAQINPTIKSNLIRLEVDNQAELVAGVVLEIDPSIKSPDWLIESLLASGIRSINLAVDISNFIMIETGQPSHCFDYQKLQGQVEIRFAKPGEVLITLDNSQLELGDQDLILADQSGPISLAGVMGGLSSAVDQDTTQILLEMVSWNPATIRRQSFRHGLRSDASTHFEKGLPAELISELALARSIQIFKDLAQAELISSIEFDREIDWRAGSLKFDLTKVSRLLGVEVEFAQIKPGLEKLGLNYLKSKGQLEIPWWRTDLEDQAGLAEEVIKLVGLDQIPIKYDRIVNYPANPSSQLLIDSLGLRKELVARGLIEVLNYTLVSQLDLELSQADATEHLVVVNPVSITHKYFRADLLPGILINLTQMIRPDLDNQELGIFEIGNAFVKGQEGLIQSSKLAIGFSGQNSLVRAREELERLVANTSLSLLTKNIEGYQPNRAAKVVDQSAKNQTVGYIGQISQSRLEKLGVKDQEISILELDLGYYFQSLERDQKYYSPYPYQLTKRDLTLRIYGDSLEFAQIKLAIEKLDFVVDVRYLGDYYHQDSRALTLRVYLDASAQPDREIIDQYIDKIGTSIWEQFRVKIE
ncbi:phenylalanine--tRNA ligase subunit beta [Candidatus Nomurabacteria bacterium]|nr:phenylalanine--tRNA ligase subunit beta [Candidatus Nomurabacteria bacterium]